MKKTLLILAVLALAIPAMAETVTITAEVIDEANGIVEIGYVVTGGTNLVRAFALDINVSEGNIVDINDYFVGECTDGNGNQGYGIFLGNIAIDTSGNVTSYGSPVAPGGDPGAQAGLGTDAITIEMGSLYEDGNAPDLTGVLCTVQCDTLPTTLCVAVEDAARGGIVMEDTAIVPTVVLPSECLLVGDGGCPCKGDLTGEGRVSVSDLSIALNILINQYGPTTIPPYTANPIPASLECMETTGDTSVSIADLSIFLNVLINTWGPTTIPPYTSDGCMP